MKTPMSFEEVFAQLESWGSETARKIYARLGADGNQFGVKLGDLRSLAKKLKTNHPLALRLWATGNSDAQILATMLMAPERFSAQELEALIAPLSYFKVVDELVGNVVVRSAFAEDLRERWMNSPAEMTGRAGWKLLVARIGEGRTDGLDFAALLAQIESEMLSAPRRKQEAMNHCLVEIGVHRPEWRQKCVALGERLGRFDPTPVPKGCTSSYAPEWIAAVLKRKK